MYVVIGYDSSTHHNPTYGDRSDVFTNWNYLDQLQSSASQLGPNARVLLLPYQSGVGHSIAAGRIDGVEGIFWDGVRIDFDDLTAQDAPA
jgi:hypothetical protein